MSTEAQRRASKKYTAANTKQIPLALNLKTDADIIDHLQKQANKQGYIKELIREAMKKEKTMNKWYLIDQRDGDYFESEMKAKSRAEAESELEAEWKSLSAHDQKHREAFFAIYAPADDDGIVDWDAAEDEIRIK